MILRLVAAFSAVGLILLAGCASAPRDVRTAPPPDAVVKPEEPPPRATPAPMDPVVVAPLPETASHKKPAPARPKNSAPPAPVLEKDEYALLVESEPAGATVVVNGKPSGKTPCRVVLKANGRGFLREQVSIKVRFIAANESESSQTVEDVLTTFDKVPAGIRFTQAGATRLVR